MPLVRSSSTIHTQGIPRQGIPRAHTDKQGTWGAPPFTEMHPESEWSKVICTPGKSPPGAFLGNASKSGGARQALVRLKVLYLLGAPVWGVAGDHRQTQQVWHLYLSQLQMILDSVVLSKYFKVLILLLLLFCYHHQKGILQNWKNKTQSNKNWSGCGSG